MANVSQSNQSISSGFLIKDKQGNIKKVDDDIIGDYQQSESQIEDMVAAPGSSAPVIPVVQQRMQPQSPPAPPKSPQKQQTSAVQPQSAAENYVTPEPATTVNSRTAFIGDADEEEEIRKHQAELDKILQEAETPISQADPQSVIDKVIEKFSISFTSDVLKNRFIKILESRIKGVRNSIETVEVLHRQTKVGGMDLPRDKAEQIVKFIDKNKDQPAVQPELQKDSEPNTPTEAAPAPVKEVDFSQGPPSFIPIQKQAPDEPVVLPEDTKEPDLIEQTAAVSKEQPTQPVPSSTAKEELPPAPPVEELYKKTPSEEMSRLASSRQQSQQRPQVVDIKQPASVVGPVEELMQINLKEFRRMGNNPGESAEKILEKIYLLEEESWDMRVKGIAGWQQSPLHQRYVGVGQVSLQQNKPVQEIILAREDSGELSLHFQEFLAINDLNSKLVL